MISVVLQLPLFSRKEMPTAITQMFVKIVVTERLGVEWIDRAGKTKQRAFAAAVDRGFAHGIGGLQAWRYHR